MLLNKLLSEDGVEVCKQEPGCAVGHVQKLMNDVHDEDLCFINTAGSSSMIGLFSFVT